MPHGISRPSSSFELLTAELTRIETRLPIHREHSWSMTQQLPSPTSSTPTLQETPKQDGAQVQFEDCTPCRIVGTSFSSTLLFSHDFILHTHTSIGSATFLGLGAFTYISGHSQIQANAATIRASKSMFGVRSRGMAITGTSAVMVGLGVYRWFS
jgi:hypothetical protein